MCISAAVHHGAIHGPLALMAHARKLLPGTVCGSRRMIGWLWLCAPICTGYRARYSAASAPRSHVMGMCWLSLLMNEEPEFQTCEECGCRYDEAYCPCCEEDIPQ